MNENSRGLHQNQLWGTVRQAGSGEAHLVRWGPVAGLSHSPLSNQVISLQVDGSEN